MQIREGFNCLFLNQASAGVIGKFLLNKSAGDVFIVPVKPFRLFVAVLLLALWVPATSHCLMESAGLMPTVFSCTDDCAPGAPGGQDADDACAALESASYKLSDDALAIISICPPVLALAFLLGESFSSAPSSPPLPTIAPPALPVTWQFLQRAALPVRSPSLPA